MVSTRELSVAFASSTPFVDCPRPERCSHRPGRGNTPTDRAVASRSEAEQAVAVDLLRQVAGCQAVEELELSSK